MKKSLFTNEVQEIRDKVAKSLMEWRKVKRMCDDVWKLQCEEAIFRFTANHSSVCEVYQSAGNALASFYYKCGMDNYCPGRVYTRKDFIELSEKVQKITNNTILEHFQKRMAPYGYNTNRVQINRNTVTLDMNYKYSLRLLLNVLNILINKEIENDEICSTSWEVLKKNNTFIYRDIKITCYQNGKIKMVFANLEIMYKLKFLLDGLEEIKEAS